STFLYHYISPNVSAPSDISTLSLHDALPILPYDAFSPHQDLVSERLQTLHALMQHAVDVLLVPVTTALYRLAPPSFLAAYTFSRSEEHTSELQSRENLVCRLLLEKKKK